MKSCTVIMFVWPDNFTTGEESRVCGLHQYYHRRKRQKKRAIEDCNVEILSPLSDIKEESKNVGKYRLLLNGVLFVQLCWHHIHFLQV
ncbi:hypothetical protein HNY73_018228 [Argiope bruennichi]|uniref:Uncharacterized protein n=1 Tax=Argiope bruennichi TaxID=94029 RepID=A0A8T0EFJ3_ARGBR|nr:hypothetical protein HNY73_018228 [Argiope bruennichi]